MRTTLSTDYSSYSARVIAVSQNGRFLPAKFFFVSACHLTERSMHLFLVIAVVRGRGGLGTGLLRPPKTPERRLGPSSGLRSCLGIAGSATPSCRGSWFCLQFCQRRRWWEAHTGRKVKRGRKKEKSERWVMQNFRGPGFDDRRVAQILDGILMVTLQVSYVTKIVKSSWICCKFNLT